MTERIDHPTESRGPGPTGTDEFGMLVVEAPPAMRGMQLPLRAPGEVVGRRGGAVLGSATVSREHARVWVADGRVHLVDLGSANGTVVNGEPVTGPRTLRDRDRVRFGDVEAVFYTAWTPRPPLGPPRAPVGSDPALSEPTRYLCAATHLDRRYREQVLDATVRETHRAVCPSYGVDLSVVARHAMLAHLRALQRDAGLTAVLVAVVVAAGWAASIGAPRAVLPLGIGLLVVAWTVLATETWVRLSTLGDFLRPGGRPDLAPSPVSARAAQLLGRLAAANAGNVVVYSVYQPFVGSGVQIDRSSYPVPLLPRGDGTQATEQQAVAFSTGELVGSISEALYDLQLDNLRIDRRLFVGGFDIARFRELLPDPRGRPIVSAPEWLLDAMTERPSGTVRPYLCAQVTGWHGQLVVTTFIRVVVLTGLLFVETATYVLAPLRKEYLAVDAMRIRTRRERLGATIAQTTARLLPTMLAAPFRLADAAAARSAAAQREREFTRRLHDRVRVDRGATSSIREQASRDEFDRYFMQLDAEMAISVVRAKVADTIAAFLEVRGYQTDKINMIQNNISNTTVNDNSFRMNNVQGNFAGVGQGASGSVSGGNGQNAGRGGTR